MRLVVLSSRYPCSSAVVRRAAMVAVMFGAGSFCGDSFSAPPGNVPNPSVAVTPAAERGPTWAGLSAAQRSALKPLEQDWHGIGPDHKQKWLEIAAQFPALSTDERQRVQARMAEWATLTPQQRGAARVQFKQAQQLAPANRAARWEAYQALSDEEKKQLATRAHVAVDERSSLRRARVTGSDDANPAAVQSKSNVVTALPDVGRPSRAVAPALVQAPTGATTTLISKRPTPPVHEQAGLPKITASPNFVNPSTLLPRRGPQGAAVVATGASAPLARP